MPEDPVAKDFTIAGPFMQEARGILEIPSNVWNLLAPHCLHSKAGHSLPQPAAGQLIGVNDFTVRLRPVLYASRQSIRSFLIPSDKC
jgi:hypothetical protein